MKNNTISITCPHCGTEYEAEEKDLYRYTKCSVCGEGFVAGADTSMRGAGLAGAATKSASVSNGSFSRKHLIVYGVLVGVILLLVGALFFRNKPREHLADATPITTNNGVAIMAVELSTNGDELIEESVENESVIEEQVGTEVQHSNEEHEVNMSQEIEQGVDDATVHRVDQVEDVMNVVERLCNGERLTYKAWRKRIVNELGINKMSNALDAELRRAGYWACRVESSGLLINVGVLTSDTTGFIREGLGGGFTYPKWLPKEDAKYIYDAFVKLDSDESVLIKCAEKYDRAFRGSRFYISPEEEERIEQASRQDFAKQLFSALCFDQKRYFYIQKRLDLSIVSARITDRRWKILSEAYANENWLEMMNIVKGDDEAKRYEKFPEKNTIVSMYNKLLGYKFNVEVTLINPSFSLPNHKNPDLFKRMEEELQRGMSEMEARRCYREKYDQYLKFSAAIKNINNVAVPYPVDLNLRVITVDRRGVALGVNHGAINSDECNKGNTVSFKFSIGAGCTHLLIVDDTWYWGQSYSEPLRVKMSKYIDEENAYYAALIKLGTAIHEQKQYTKEEELSLYKDINEKYRRTLLSAISSFMGKTVVLPPEYERLTETEVNKKKYAPIYKSDDAVISKSDLAMYRLVGKGKNRFEEYKKERMEREKTEALIENFHKEQRERERREKEKRRKEMEREAARARSEKYRMKGPYSR